MRYIPAAFWHRSISLVWFVTVKYFSISWLSYLIRAIFLCQAKTWLSLNQKWPLSKASPWVNSLSLMVKFSGFSALNINCIIDSVSRGEQGNNRCNKFYHSIILAFTANRFYIEGWKYATIPYWRRYLIEFLLYWSLICLLCLQSLKPWSLISEGRDGNIIKD